MFVSIAVFSKRFFHFLGGALSALITKGISFTFIFHSFCSSRARSWHFSIFSVSSASIHVSYEIPLFDKCYSHMKIRSSFRTSMKWSVRTEKCHILKLPSLITDSGWCSKYFSFNWSQTHGIFHNRFSYQSNHLDAYASVATWDNQRVCD